MRRFRRPYDGFVVRPPPIPNFAPFPNPGYIQRPWGIREKQGPWSNKESQGTWNRNEPSGTPRREESWSRKESSGSVAPQESQGSANLEDFYCKNCKIQCNGPITFKLHCEGNKHKKALGQNSKDSQGNSNFTKEQQHNDAAKCIGTPIKTTDLDRVYKENGQSVTGTFEGNLEASFPNQDKYHEKPNNTTDRLYLNRNDLLLIEKNGLDIARKFSMVDLHQSDTRPNWLSRSLDNISLNQREKLSKQHSDHADQDLMSKSLHAETYSHSQHADLDKFNGRTMNQMKRSSSVVFDELMKSGSLKNKSLENENNIKDLICEVVDVVIEKLKNEGGVRIIGKQQTEFPWTCWYCNVTCNGEKTKQRHLLGKKHRREEEQRSKAHAENETTSNQSFNRNSEVQYVAFEVPDASELSEFSDESSEYEEETIHIQQNGQILSLGRDKDQLLYKAGGQFGVSIPLQNETFLDLPIVNQQCNNELKMNTQSSSFGNIQQDSYKNIDQETQVSNVENPQCKVEEEHKSLELEKATPSTYQVLHPIPNEVVSSLKNNIEKDLHANYAKGSKFQSDFTKKGNERAIPIVGDYELQIPRFEKNEELLHFKYENHVLDFCEENHIEKVCHKTIKATDELQDANQIGVKEKIKDSSLFNGNSNASADENKETLQPTSNEENETKSKGHTLVTKEQIKCSLIKQSLDTPNNDISLSLKEKDSPCLSNKETNPDKPKLKISELEEDRQTSICRKNTNHSASENEESQFSHEMKPEDIFTEKLKTPFLHEEKVSNPSINKGHHLQDFQKNDSHERNIESSRMQPLHELSKAKQSIRGKCHQNLESEHPLSEEHLTQEATSPNVSDQSKEDKKFQNSISCINLDPAKNNINIKVIQPKIPEIVVLPVLDEAKKQKSSIEVSEHSILEYSSYQNKDKCDDSSMPVTQELASVHKASIYKSHLHVPVPDFQQNSDEGNLKLPTFIQAEYKVPSITIKMEERLDSLSDVVTQICNSSLELSSNSHQLCKPISEERLNVNKGVHDNKNSADQTENPYSLYSSNVRSPSTIIESNSQQKFKAYEMFSTQTPESCQSFLSGISRTGMAISNKYDSPTQDHLPSDMLSESKYPVGSEKFNNEHFPFNQTNKPQGMISESNLENQEKSPKHKNSTIPERNENNGKPVNEEGNVINHSQLKKLQDYDPPEDFKSSQTRAKTEDTHFTKVEECAHQKEGSDKESKMSITISKLKEFNSTVISMDEEVHNDDVHLELENSTQIPERSRHTEDNPAAKQLQRDQLHHCSNNINSVEFGAGSIQFQASSSAKQLNKNELCQNQMNNYKPVQNDVNPKQNQAVSQTILAETGAKQLNEDKLSQHLKMNSNHVQYHSDSNQSQTTSENIRTECNAKQLNEEELCQCLKNNSKCVQHHASSNQSPTMCENIQRDSAANNLDEDELHHYTKNNFSYIQHEAIAAQVVSKHIKNSSQLQTVGKNIETSSVKKQLDEDNLHHLRNNTSHIQHDVNLSQFQIVSKNIQPAFAAHQMDENTVCDHLENNIKYIHCHATSDELQKASKDIQIASVTKKQDEDDLQNGLKNTGCIKGDVTSNQHHAIDRSIQAVLVEKQDQDLKYNADSVLLQGASVVDQLNEDGLHHHLKNDKKSVEYNKNPSHLKAASAEKQCDEDEIHHQLKSHANSAECNVDTTQLQGVSMPKQLYGDNLPCHPKSNTNSVEYNAKPIQLKAVFVADQLNEEELCHKLKGNQSSLEYNTDPTQIQGSSVTKQLNEDEHCHYLKSNQHFVEYNTNPIQLETASLVEKANEDELHHLKSNENSVECNEDPIQVEDPSVEKQLNEDELRYHLKTNINHMQDNVNSLVQSTSIEEGKFSQALANSEYQIDQTKENNFACPKEKGSKNPETNPNNQQSCQISSNILNADKDGFRATMSAFIERPTSTSEEGQKLKEFEECFSQMTFKQRSDLLKKLACMEQTTAEKPIDETGCSSQGVNSCTQTTKRFQEQQGEAMCEDSLDILNAVTNDSFYSEYELEGYFRKFPGFKSESQFIKDESLLQPTEEVNAHGKTSEHSGISPSTVLDCLKFKEGGTISQSADAAKTEQNTSNCTMGVKNKTFLETDFAEKPGVYKNIGLKSQCNFQENLQLHCQTCDVLCKGEDMLRFHVNSQEHKKNIMIYLATMESRSSENTTCMSKKNPQNYQHTNRICCSRNENEEVMAHMCLKNPLFEDGFSESEREPERPASKEPSNCLASSMALPHDCSASLSSPTAKSSCFTDGSSRYSEFSMSKWHNIPKTNKAMYNETFYPAAQSFSCDVCKKWGLSFTTYQAHIRGKVHLRNQRRQTCGFKCSHLMCALCNVQFESLEGYRKHVDGKWHNKKQLAVGSCSNKEEDECCQHEANKECPLAASKGNAKFEPNQNKQPPQAQMGNRLLRNSFSNVPFTPNLLQQMQPLNLQRLEHNALQMSYQQKMLALMKCLQQPANLLAMAQLGILK